MSEQEDLPPAEEFFEEPAEGVTDSTESKDDNTVTFKKSHLYTILLPLAFLTGLAFGFILWGRDSALGANQPEDAAVSAKDQGQPAPPGVEPTPEFRRYNVPEDDDPVWGPDEAAITIIEFSDFECPYCRQWHSEVWPRLQEEYAGQIRLVYRDFPLTSIHGNATPAAAAANCAREQDMYWEYNEKLFAMELNLSKTTYQKYAEDLGLNMGAFNDCLDNGRYLAEVEADYDYAVNLGIRSTPTFFVNGIPVVGAQPFDVFKTVIDKELAGELPR